MPPPLRLAVTADLHWGHRSGETATRRLVADLHADPPGVLILAGDLGTGAFFGECLAMFDSLDCVKALVPGNHDLWVGIDSRYDSLQMYEEILPRLSAEHGFHYLDREPLILPEADLAVVGSINWYDYSWAIDGIRRNFPDDEHRLASKQFARGTHNDANFVRWPLDDLSFTSLVTATLRKHLVAALAQASRAVVVTHHPCFYGLSFPRNGPPVELDSFLWDAFAGNVGVEQVLAEFAPRIAMAFSGHTHRERHTTWQGIEGYNVGSDYPVKRLLRVEWPSMRVEGTTFEATGEVG